MRWCCLSLVILGIALQGSGCQQRAIAPAVEYDVATVKRIEARLQQMEWD